MGKKSAKTTEVDRSNDCEIAREIFYTQNHKFNANERMRQLIILMPMSVTFIKTSMHGSFGAFGLYGYG